MAMAGERIKMEVMENIRDNLSMAIQSKMRDLMADDYILRSIKPREAAGMMMKAITKYGRAHAAAKKQGTRVDVSPTPEVPVSDTVNRFTQTVVNELSKNVVSGDLANYDPKMIDFNTIAKMIIMTGVRAAKGGLFDHIQRSEIVTEIAKEWVSRNRSGAALIEAEVEGNIMLMLLEDSQKQYFEVFDPQPMLGLHSPSLWDRIETRLEEDNDRESDEGHRNRTS